MQQCLLMRQALHRLIGSTEQGLVATRTSVALSGLDRQEPSQLKVKNCCMTLSSLPCDLPLRECLQLPPTHHGYESAQGAHCGARRWSEPWVVLSDRPQGHSAARAPNLSLLWPNAGTE